MIEMKSFDLRNRTYNIYLKQFHRGLVQKFGYMNHILKQFSVSVLTLFLMFLLPCSG